jgi:hypothetical protein
MNRSIKKIGGALITLLMVAGFSLAAGSTAQAQYRRDRNRNGVNDRYERNRDWRRDRNSNVYDRNRNGVDDRYERGSVYDRNRNGVDDRYERNGGYYGTYGNNGRYGNNGGYNQAAMNQGYQNGLNTGASDAQRGQSYNPQRSHFYREASSQAFRDGFVQGYEQGYRQYAGYNNGGYRRSNGNIGNILGGIFGRP